MQGVSSIVIHPGDNILGSQAQTCLLGHAQTYRMLGASQRLCACYEWWTGNAL